MPTAGKAAKPTPQRRTMDVWSARRCTEVSGRPSEKALRPTWIVPRREVRCSESRKSKGPSEKIDVPGASVLRALGMGAGMEIGTVGGRGTGASVEG